MPTTEAIACQWLRTGDEAFPLMLAAIGSARESVRFETYIYAGDKLGLRFLDALVAATRRGVRVQVLIDAFGSLTLPGSFWQPLQDAGGAVRRFNSDLLQRFGFRDHRKMLVCDHTTAFVGGFNISADYLGDGVKSGWCDLGLQLTGPLSSDLAAAFDDMFARAGERPRPLQLLRRTTAKREVAVGEGRLLLSAPGRGANPYKRLLHRDLANPARVRIIAAYFLPTHRMRRDLARLARRGLRVQIILPGKSDVLLSQLAGRSLYRRLLKAGVEIYEYQPQILHAKLTLIDDVVYMGSSNLDPRSLFLNYELVLRFQNPALAAGADAIFEEKLAHCRRIELEAWRKSRTWWRRFKQRWVYFLLVRVDPFIARWQWK